MFGGICHGFGLVRDKVALFVHFIFQFFKKAIPQSKPDAAIPTPRTRLPLLGHVQEFMQVFGPNAHHWLMKRRKEFDRLYSFSALGRHMVYLFRFEDLLTLKKTEGKYPEHFDFKHLRLYRQRNNLPMGLLVSKDEDWSLQRRTTGRLMTTTASAVAFTPHTLQTADETVRTLSAISRGITELSIDTHVSTYVFKAMAWIILGLPDSERETTGADLKQIVEIARENVTDAKVLMSLPSFLWSLLPAWSRHSARWDRLLDITRRYIEGQLEREKHGGSDQVSVLHGLLASPALTLSDVHVDISDLILASIDTTTSTLLWLVHELSLHPEVQQRLRKEFEVMTDCHSDVTYHSLKDNAYLQAVLRESMRLHPVGFFTSRVTKSDTEVHGYSLAKGIHVACSMYAIGRDEKLFEDPDVFCPERWLTKAPFLDTFYSNVPFGFGKRMCIGRKVAEIVIMCFIFKMCRAFQFVSTDMKAIDPTFRVFMVPSEPVKIKLENLID